MNKIKEAFKLRKAFIPFITAGDPDLETTEKLIPEIAKAGADLIEIGIPFSDPVAEGPIIQQADERALAAGFTTDKLFAMVKRVRTKTTIPILFMTYINPVFVYGKENFIKQCAECGINGIIVPDMPFEEKEELSSTCSKYSIDLISLIAPTSENRITTIAQEAEGFVYCVSSLGVTGIRGKIESDIEHMINQVREVTKTPCAVGFGVSTPEQAADVSKIADGVIVGSAIVKLISEHGSNCILPVTKLIGEMRKAIDNAQV